MRRRVLLTSVPAALLLSACRGDVGTAEDPGAAYGVFFPRHSLKPPQPLPTSGIRGLLTLREGCIWIEPAHGREVFLALWPPGWVPSRSGDTLEIHDAARKRMGAIGEEIAVAGGETTDPRNIAQLIGREPPPACREHKAWLVTYLLQQP